MICQTTAKSRSLCDASSEFLLSTKLCYNSFNIIAISITISGLNLIVSNSSLIITKQKSFVITSSLMSEISRRSKWRVSFISQKYTNKKSSATSIVAFQSTLQKISFTVRTFYTSRFASSLITLISWYITCLIRSFNTILTLEYRYVTPRTIGT